MDEPSETVREAPILSAGDLLGGGVSSNALRLTGMRFGRLTVIARSGERHFKSGSKSQWLCRCDCGNTATPLGSSLTTGNTTSCGCVSLEILRTRNTTHGKTGTRTYRAWRAMLNRCLNPKAVGYENYGGRGITVCNAWRSFEKFRREMGDAPPGLSLERKNNDGNYSKRNCRWATRHDQNRNKRSNRIYTFAGKTQCLRDWAAQIGINQTSLSERLERWSIDRAFTEPNRSRRTA